MLAYKISFNQHLTFDTPLRNVPWSRIGKWQPTVRAWQCLLSITWFETNLKGHELTPNILDPLGMTHRCRLQLACRKLYSKPSWSMAFHCALTRHRNHMWTPNRLLLIHIAQFLYLQRMKHSDRKAAAIDWLVGTLFWVTFHKWSRLVK